MGCSSEVLQTTCRKSHAWERKCRTEYVIASNCFACRACYLACPTQVESRNIFTLGISCEEYLTGFQLPSDSERIHASMAASLFFSASSTYLQDLIMLGHTGRTNKA